MKLSRLETRLLCHFMENVYSGHAPLKDFTNEGTKKLTEILTIKMADYLIPELKGLNRDELIRQRVWKIIKVHEEHGQHTPEMDTIDQQRKNIIERYEAEKMEHS